MILDDLSITQSAGATRLSARVSSRAGLPGRIFMESEDAPGHAWRARADAFAPALLFAAMRVGEDLELRAPVSPHLVEGLEEIGVFFNQFFPAELKRIRILAPDPQPSPPLTEPVTACAFSGGIDSLHTAWCHRPADEAVPGSAVRWALFARGFDRRLGSPRAFEVARNSNRTVLSAIGVRLVTINTNIREFVQSANWELAHGAAIAGLGHALGGSVSRLLIASSRPIPHAVPWGSDPRIDHLFSSESMEVMHDASTFSRLDKFVRLKEWPACAAYIRSCWKGPHPDSNCCRCRVCVLVRTCARAAGWTVAMPTFPRPLRRADARALEFDTISLRALAREMIAGATAQGETALAADLRVALLHSTLRHHTGYFLHGAANAWRRLGVARS